MVEFSRPNGGLARARADPLIIIDNNIYEPTSFSLLVLLLPATYLAAGCFLQGVPDPVVSPALDDWPPAGGCYCLALLLSTSLLSCNNLTCSSSL